MVAQQCDLEVGDFVWTGGDAHLYMDHLEQAREQLTRQPATLPKLKIKRRPPTLYDYVYEDFDIADYKAQPHIAAPISV
jgi:thymidylate synthase